jgi:hypothetical protein
LIVEEVSMLCRANTSKFMTILNGVSGVAIGRLLIAFAVVVVSDRSKGRRRTTFMEYSMRRSRRIFVLTIVAREGLRILLDQTAGDNSKESSAMKRFTTVNDRGREAQYNDSRDHQQVRSRNCRRFHGRCT